MRVRPCHGARATPRRQSGLNELLFAAGAEMATHPEDTAMTEEKKKEPEQETPAHATEQERERLKDFNKDGIPPGAC